MIHLSHDKRVNYFDFGYITYYSYVCMEAKKYKHVNVLAPEQTFQYLPLLSYRGYLHSNTYTNRHTKNHA